MPIIEIKINGEIYCKAGGPLAPQVGVYIGNSQESKEVTLSINGYRESGPHITEHREWPKKEIENGDEVTVILKSEGEISKPEKISTFDNRPNQKKLENMIAEMIVESRLSGKGPGPVLPKDALVKSRFFCSFCAKHSSEVKTLIAGPSVYICDECIDVCKELIINNGTNEHQ
jgi:hypothetical protein